MAGWLSFMDRSTASWSESLGTVEHVKLHMSGMIKTKFELERKKSRVEGVLGNVGLGCDTTTRECSSAWSSNQFTIDFPSILIVVSCH